MSTSLKNAGSRIAYPNTGALIASGAIVQMNSGSNGMIGIAVDAIAAGTTGTPVNGAVDIGYPNGVHTLAKNSGEAFTPGQKLYINSSNALTGTASTNTPAGRSDGIYNSAAVLAGCIINLH